MKRAGEVFPQNLLLLYAFSVSLFSTSFTVFDVETTGLAPGAGDRIVEIAGVRIENGKICPEKTFLSLINPQRKISWEAQSVNNIQGEDLEKAPTIDIVLPQFLDFARGSILVAHNAQFDVGFLEAEKEMCWGYNDIPECLCTLCLSRKVHPHEYGHKLENVATRLKIPLPSDPLHRALPDVLLTAQVFLKLLSLADIQTLDVLRAKASPFSLSWRSK